MSPLPRFKKRDTSVFLKLIVKFYILKLEKLFILVNIIIIIINYMRNGTNYKIFNFKLTD